MALVPVTLSAREIDLADKGFSNAILWRLHHEVLTPPIYRGEFWHAYSQVNRRFADVTANVAAAEATVWVHDYQLQLMPAMLRELRPDVRIGFFLHVPFPAPGTFDGMPRPWQESIVRGLLGADLIGFQTPRDASNFEELCHDVLGIRVQGQACLADRVVRIGVFPVSVDFAELSVLAGREEARTRAREIRARVGESAKLLLAVDRLDYAKGIPQRLEALDELFESGDIEQGEVVLVQVASPSSERVEMYEDLVREVEQKIGHINGEYGQIGAPAVHYVHRNVPRDELVALYLAADVMVATPLRDGMNLACKEYVTCHDTPGGALVLSEFAGAAEELRDGAFLVNPHDIDGIKAGLLDAIHGDPVKLDQRIAMMRDTVRNNDAERWAQRFVTMLETSGSNSLHEHLL